MTEITDLEEHRRARGKPPAIRHVDPLDLLPSEQMKEGERERSRLKRGLALYQLRMATLLTQRQISDLTGHSLLTLDKLEKGQAATVDTLALLYSIAHACKAEITITITTPSDRCAGENVTVIRHDKPKPGEPRT